MILTLSPNNAPPVRGDDGSIASRAIFRPEPAPSPHMCGWLSRSGGRMRGLQRIIGGSLCNYRHPGPGACGRWALTSSPCHHFGLSRDRRDELKRPKCYYTRHFRAREVRGPCCAMRRLRSGSRRSRACENTAKATFSRKNTHDLEDFFSCFRRAEPNALFLQ